MNERPDGDRGGGTIRVRVLRHGKVTQSFVVKRNTFTIGAGEGVDFRVRGVPDLAPEHALVWLDEGAPTVEPARGAAVLVNDEPIYTPQRITSSDVITLGSMKIGLEGIFEEPSPTIEMAMPAFEPERAPAEAAEASPPPPAPPLEDDREQTVPDLSLTELLQETVQRREAPLNAPSAQDEGFFDDVEDDEYDEDDEETFVEPFSLVEHLRKRIRLAPSGPREQYVAAQVVRHSDGRVWDVSLVRPGNGYDLGEKQGSLLTVGDDGVATLRVQPGMTGSVGVGASESNLSEVEGETVRLGEGDWASVETAGCGYIVSMIRPPRPTRQSLIGTVVSAGFLLVYAFAVTSAVGGGALAIASGGSANRDQRSDDDHTLVALQTHSLALLPPQIDVVQDEPVEPDIEETPTSPEATLEPERGPPLRRVARSSARGGRGGSAASRLLAKLRGGSGGSGSNSSLADVITNIDSVGSSGPGLFRVTGVYQDLPGGQVKIGRAGGDGVQTIGGEELRSKNPFLGRVQPTKGRRDRPPRGRVVRLPPRGRGPGELDPAAVQRAINGALGAIRRCYESRLLSNPTLSGQVVVGWTVTPSGAPSGVRTRVTTISDPAVGNCVAGVIRRLHFPRPRGGAVHITYPFIFRAVN